MLKTIVFVHYAGGTAVGGREEGVKKKGISDKSLVPLICQTCYQGD